MTVQKELGLLAFCDLRGTMGVFEIVIDKVTWCSLSRRLTYMAALSLKQRHLVLAI